MDINNSVNEETIESWDDLNLKTDLLRGIYNYGFENPSNIQKQAILPIIQGFGLVDISAPICA